MNQDSSATLPLGKLDPDDWYALVFEKADEIRKQNPEMTHYDALHYAARWLRGERD